jgi:hypothetical protein
LTPAEPPAGDADPAAVVVPVLGALPAASRPGPPAAVPASDAVTVDAVTVPFFLRAPCTITVSPGRTSPALADAERLTVAPAPTSILIVVPPVVLT